MTIKGNEFMIVWHDIKEVGEPDYHLWHTREHMPERLGTPGFYRGRRGVNWTLNKYRYLTLYEGREGVFGSSEYLRRLNNPTPWTKKNQPNFYNFIRCGCKVLTSLGQGVGGAMATFRLELNGEEETLRARAQSLSEEIYALAGVNAVHIGLARPEMTNAKTTETELRKTKQDDVFDAVLIVDGVGDNELTDVFPKIKEHLSKADISVADEGDAIYMMAYLLESDT